MTLLSVNLDSILQCIGQDGLPATTKIEDQTYIDNALRHIQMAKAYDLLDFCEKAYHETQRALDTVNKLVALRKEQLMTDKVGNVNYESLLAPFYYRAGDSLAVYI